MPTEQFIQPVKRENNHRVLDIIRALHASKQSPVYVSPADRIRMHSFLVDVLDDAGARQVVHRAGRVVRSTRVLVELFACFEELDSDALLG